MKGKFVAALVRLFTAIQTKDAAAVTAELEKIEVDSDEQAADPAVAELGTRVGAIETGLGEIKTLLTTDQAARAAAAAAAAAPTLELNAERIGEIRSRAEILAPGISIPTVDALAAGDAAQQLMRAALEQAHGDAAGVEHVKPFLMGREVKTLDGEALLGAFNGAAELTRVRNNQASARATQAAKTTDFGKATQIANINKANAAFWSRQ